MCINKVLQLKNHWKWENERKKKTNTIDISKRNKIKQKKS